MRKQKDNDQSEVINERLMEKEKLRKEIIESHFQNNDFFNYVHKYDKYLMKKG